MILPESPEELTQYYLTEGIPLFSYFSQCDIAEESKIAWVAINKDWAVERITMKRVVDRPFLTVKFAYKAIIDNLVILIPFSRFQSENIQQDQIFKSLGIIGNKTELLCMLDKQSGDGVIVIFENENLNIP
jgi:hypothetical protein